MQQGMTLLGMLMLVRQARHALPPMVRPQALQQRASLAQLQRHVLPLQLLASQRQMPTRTLACRAVRRSLTRAWWLLPLTPTRQQHQPQLALVRRVMQHTARVRRQQQRQGTLWQHQRQKQRPRRHQQRSQLQQRCWWRSSRAAARGGACLGVARPPPPRPLAPRALRCGPCRQPLQALGLLPCAAQHTQRCLLRSPLLVLLVQVARCSGLAQRQRRLLAVHSSSAVGRRVWLGVEAVGCGARRRHSSALRQHCCTAQAPKHQQQHRKLQQRSRVSMSCRG
jgi:hypothetical protein